jgi:hypothetical protein
MLLSPFLLCGYFIWQLFALHDFVPAVTYLVLLIPIVSLSFALLYISFSVGIREAILMEEGHSPPKPDAN